MGLHLGKHELHQLDTVVREKWIDLGVKHVHRRHLDIYRVFLQKLRLVVLRCLFWKGVHVISGILFRKEHAHLVGFAFGNNGILLIQSHRYSYVLIILRFVFLVIERVHVLVTWAYFCALTTSFANVRSIKVEASTHAAPTEFWAIVLYTFHFCSFLSMNS